MMFDFSGLVAVLFGFGLMATAFVCFLTGFIVAIVIKSKKNIPVFKQKASAFIIGGLFQLVLGAILFIGGTELWGERSDRKEMDEISPYYAIVIVTITVIVIVLRFRSVSNKHSSPQ